MAGGGAERVISILANEFDKRAIHVTILMTADSKLSYKLSTNVDLVCLGGRTYGNTHKRIERIKKMRRFFMERPDSVIIAFGPDISIFTMLSLIGLKNKVILSERNDPAAFSHKYIRNWAYGQADEVVFQTDQAMKCFPGRIRQKGIVIPNPVRSNLPESEYIRLGVKRKITGKIVSVGRLEKQKNHNMLLESFGLFCSKQKDSEYSLHIYGDGILKEELEKKATELGIADNVVFEGFSSNVVDDICDADMYVLSSDYEGISNSLLEAMAIGLPVISTKCPIGGSEMCISDGENGLLTQVGNAESTANAMLRVANDSEYALSLAEKAFQIRHRYSGETIAKEWINTI